MRRDAKRLTNVRPRLGTTEAEAATRMGVTQERVSAIGYARPRATGLRTVAAYAEALGRRLEIVAGSVGQWLAITKDGSEAPSARSPTGACVRP